MFGLIYFRCPVQMLMCHVHLLNDGRLFLLFFAFIQLLIRIITSTYFHLQVDGWPWVNFFPENKNSAWKISMDNAGNETHHPSI